MRFRRIIMFMVLILSLLLGCNYSENCLHEKDLNPTMNEVQPLLVMDISINGENRSNILITPSDKKKSDIGDDTIFSLFSDGTVIYSENDIETGPPYSTIKVKDTQVEVLFDSLNEYRIFEDKRWEFYSSPSSDFVQIYINYNGQVVVYSSWHELYEDNPKLVVTDYGIVALEGKDRAEIIESRSEEYEAFLYKWKRIRDTVKNLIESSNRGKNETGPYAIK